MKAVHVLGAALLGLAGAPASAAALPGGNIYRWPDLGSGMWAPDMSKRYGGGNGAMAKLLKPEAAAIGKAEMDKRGGSASCAPVGPVGIIGAGFPIKFYFSPGEIVMMSDMDQLTVRHVYMDGRKHPGGDDLMESYHGHSIGHWEGKTLVIDTVGLSPKTSIGGGVPASPATTHLVERYTLLGPARMHLQETLFDPAAMTAPYVLEEDFIHHADWAIEDTYCGENNRDDPAGNGGQALDLTPPR